MGITEILTIIFVLLKVFGKIDWPWWVVFSPEIVGLVIYMILFFIGVHATHKAIKDFDNYFNNLF